MSDVNIPIFDDPGLSNPLEPTFDYNYAPTSLVPVKPVFGNHQQQRNPGPGYFNGNPLIPPPSYGFPPSGTQEFAVPTFNSGYVNATPNPPSILSVETQAAINFIFPSDKVKDAQLKGLRYFDSLRPYFNVKKIYVQKKIGILLFPYLHKSWYRQQDTFMDINSPDLYIPLMSAITYILLVGFFMGTQFRFTPDVLGKTLTTVMTIVLLEVFAIKGSSFIWPLQTPILDTVAYSGYKFVGIIVNVIAGLLLGNYGLYVAFILTSLSMCYFQAKTFQSILTENGPSTKPFLLLLIVLQILTSLFLCNMQFSTGLIFQN